MLRPFDNAYTRKYHVLKHVVAYVHQVSYIYIYIGYPDLGRSAIRYFSKKAVFFACHTFEIFKAMFLTIHPIRLDARSITLFTYLSVYRNTGTRLAGREQNLAQ